MAKITRKIAKIFGMNSGFQEVAEFGSLAAAAPVFTLDPAVIQSLSNYLDGWFAAVLGNNSPAIEDMNALCYLFAYQIAYLMQEGVAEWEAGTTYFIGSMVNSGGQVYVSLIDNNLNNAVTTNDWSLLSTTGNVNIDPATQSPYTMSAKDNNKVFLVNSANGAQIFTLPTPVQNFKFTIKDSGGAASASNITINQHGSEKIDGQNSYILYRSYGSVTLDSDGTSWFVVQEDNEPNMWKGFHSSSFNGSPWTTMSTSFVDLTNQDTSVAINESLNINFGTVNGYGADSGGSALPGIVFTPKKLGKYFIKATTVLNAIGANLEYGARLMQGSTIIDASPGVYPGLSNTQVYSPCTMSGIIDVTSLSAVTLSIQGVTTGNTMSLGSGAGTIAGSHVIEWSIWKM